jgi:hypothetical protein
MTETLEQENARLKAEVETLRKKFDLRFCHLRTELEHRQQHCQEHLLMIEEDEKRIAELEKQLSTLQSEQGKERG